VDVIHAARAVADLYPNLPIHTRNARGLFGASVDGWVCEAVWTAARL